MAHFVLVHGGFAGGWCWKKVKNALEGHGHTVSAPTLTGLGERQHSNSPEVTLETHIQDITALFTFEDIHNAILVGHSYGGLVITGVAARIPTYIQQLIFVDALVPQSGDSLMTIVDAETAQFFTTQAEELGQGWLIPSLSFNEFADPADVSWFNARCTPQSLASFEQPLVFNEDAITGIKTTFIACSRNTHPITHQMTQRALMKQWSVITLESDHFPMVNHAHDLTQILLQQA